ncbi:MAG: chromate resistance protein [Acidobacteria bacterium]|nr:chromate resistance protein [Acidobacteriota bacterium]
MPKPHRLDTAAPAPAATPAAHRWLLFVHQLPATPSNLRVRTWRRLQQLGAVPVKQAVYVLPDSAAAREDFEWLKAEITGAGGDATVFAADTLDTWSADALVEEFRRSRQEGYMALARDVEQVLARLDAVRRPRGTRRPAGGRLVDGFRQRLAALEHIDFFGSAGRDRVVALVAQLDARSRSHPPTDTPSHVGPVDRTRIHGRLWVTRPRPGVDRMGSAWLIRRFIDADARFAFAADRDAVPSPDAIPFDMFSVEFSHQGDDCTFETLCRVFDITDPAVARLAQLVHDLDLKDARFGAPDAGTVGTLIEGLQLTTADDDRLLERGMTIFESMYLAFARSARKTGPRPLANTRARPATAGRRRPVARARGK